MGIGVQATYIAEIQACGVVLVKGPKMHTEVDVRLLRVIILADSEGWYAQGFEMDHDAEGSSLEEVKERFETGLAGLVRAHLDLFGHLSTLVGPTPQETCDSMLGDHLSFTSTCLSFSDRDDLKPLPFSGICYMEPAPRAG